MVPRNTFCSIPSIPIQSSRDQIKNKLNPLSGTIVAVSDYSSLDYISSLCHSQFWEWTNWKRQKRRRHSLCRKRAKVWLPSQYIESNISSCRDVIILFLQLVVIAWRKPRARPRRLLPTTERKWKRRTKLLWPRYTLFHWITAANCPPIYFWTWQSVFALFSFSI